MKSALLVGCGAEIGATLVALNEPQRDGFAITATLTNPIGQDKKNSHLSPADSIAARIILSQPHMLDDIKVDGPGNAVSVRGRRMEIHWGDATQYDLARLGQRFDLCILATSKKHIGDDRVIRRFESVADYVLGVAEAPQLPAVYANLQGASDRLFTNRPRPIGNDRVFAVGSCQSNGWHGMLRALLESVEATDMRDFDLRGVEVDIVHPDTPTGQLGTRSMEPRSQDPRNNLRPSFSQIESSMKLLYPAAHAVNSIALRTLVMPPGYQVSRFFFRYTTRDGRRLTRDDFARSFDATAKRMPLVISTTDTPLGSRAYEFSKASAVVMTSPQYLRFFDDPFRLGGDSPVSELLVQGYVHNVRAYCYSVLEIGRMLAAGAPVQAFRAAA